MSLDLKAAKRRLAIMGLVNVAAVLAAAGALYGYFALGIAWGLAAFALLMLAGVGAQIWFIAGVMRANKGV